MNANIWVYIGVIGSGKDYTANKKLKETNGVLKSFSDGVRRFTWKFLGWQPETDLEYEQFKLTNFILPMLNGAINCDGRKFLENTGKLFRELDVNFWANHTVKECDEAIKLGVKDIIIYDCRYLNEAKCIFNFAISNNHNIFFKFCNFKSHRMEIREDESEYFAQYFLNKGFKDGDNLLEEVIKLIEDEKF